MNGRLLDETGAMIRRFVVLTDAQVAAVALWVFHTHAFEAAETTPYLSVTSADKRSGKTRLLEVLELLVRTSLPTANISDAALFRAIAQLKPTLLFDEVDAIFGPKARDREDLRGMLNAGYRRGALALRMGGQNMRKLEPFPVFCPKAFAGIGELPDTIRDRTIRIRLERRTRDEPIERFRRRDAIDQADPIRQSLESFAADHSDALAHARPELPDELDDRAQDCWEPLLAIADLAGGDWPARARAAAITLSTGDGREDEALGARLLADIRDIFEANGTKRYKTADLIAELAKVEESPWGDWRQGKPITAQGLSGLLKRHRIKTMPVKTEGLTVRGYKLEQFDDAFRRVLGVTGVTGVTSESSSQERGNTPNPKSVTGVTTESRNHAGSNAGNAGNTPHAGGETNGRLPVAGEPGYPMVIDRAFSNGHITETELHELQAFHRLGRDGRTPEAPPPLDDAEVDDLHDQQILGELESSQDKLLQRADAALAMAGRYRPINEGGNT